MPPRQSAALPSTRTGVSHTNDICSKDIGSFEGGGVIRRLGRSSSLMKASNEEADGVAGPRQYILQCLQSRQSHSAKEALP